MQETEVAAIKRKRKYALFVGIAVNVLATALFAFWNPNSINSPGLRLSVLALAAVAQGAAFFWAAFTLLRYKLPKDSR